MAEDTSSTSRGARSTCRWATRGKARSELEAVTVDETTPEPIVEAYYRHVDAFYRQVDDREALVTVVPRALVEHGAEAGRAAPPRAPPRAMVRGVSVSQNADARLARERAGVTAREAKASRSRLISRATSSPSAALARAPGGGRRLS